MKLMTSLIGVIAHTALLATLQAADAPYAVKPAQQELFVDDVLISEQSGLTYTAHACEKLDRPVVDADKPWEKNRVYLYGTVERDAETGRFRMWYSGGGLAYAESGDGINWTKPELDFHEHKGQKTNLLVTGSNLACVVLDPTSADPAKKYKLLDNTEHYNFIGFYSADGFEWHKYEQEPLIGFGSELVNAFRDPATGRYFAYIRPYLPKHYPKSVKEKRLVAVTTSDDFVNWSPMKVIVEPDSVDDAWVTNEEQRTEFYSMSGFRYGSQYLGLLPVFKITKIYEEKQPLQSKYEGPIEAELVHSRDGLAWERAADRSPVIPAGPYGYDAGCIMNVSNLPVMVGDEVWYYYTALSTTHGGTIPDKRATIGLAKWRLDGFVSRDAGEAGGELTTVPLRLPQGMLSLNADATGGEIRVALLDVNGQPVPGYALEDCTPITGDSVRHAVTWRERNEVPTGEDVRIRIVATNADLYSFQVQPKSTP
jgi:hypothetical protein